MLDDVFSARRRLSRARRDAAGDRRGIRLELLEPMSHPFWDDHRHPEAESLLAIVHTQYHRALTRAARGEPAECASARIEAHRLLKVAVELRGHSTAQAVGGRAPGALADRGEPA